ncbi:MAG: ribokinase [Paracoccus sp. (in: a-proteobacteria)]
MTLPLIFLGTTNLDIVFYSGLLPRTGQSLMGKIEEFGGGKGANQAIAAARLGANPKFATLLGDDESGRMLTSMLEGFGVQSDKICMLATQKTGRALIFVGGDGANMIGIDAGANEAFGPEHVANALKGVSDKAVMVVEMGLPVEACRAAFRQKGQRFLIFNPAPVRAQLSDEDYAAIDILTPNNSEAEELSGVKVTTIPEAMHAAKRLVERGTRGVAITMGEQGAVYLDADRQIHQPAFPVAAVDTTAAGDAFNGGLAAAIARGMVIDDALRFGVAVASLSVTRKGAQQSMPTHNQVESFLAEQGVH